MLIPRLLVTPMAEDIMRAATIRLLVPSLCLAVIALAAFASGGSNAQSTGVVVPPPDVVVPPPGVPFDMARWLQTTPNQAPRACPLVEYPSGSSANVQLQLSNPYFKFYNNMAPQSCLEDGPYTWGRTS